MSFLPTNKREMDERGWDQADFVYICGDAYVDHPSFGMAIITRLLEAKGYKVGIIAQPDWRDPESIAALGEPRLAFLVSSGNMDSMVNHYTVAKKRRHSDFYSPGGKAGLRPDHACVVYGNLIRRTFKDTPIVLGGIEASLRRLAHYDYWSDKLKRSILLDSGADLISYGMGEHSIVAIADALDAGLAVSDLTYIPGTVFRTRSLDAVYEPIMLPTWEDMQADKLKYAESFGVQCKNLNPYLSHSLVEEYPHGVYVVQNAPALPLTTQEMDAVYALPYERTYHPRYEDAGGVPAIKEVKFSIASNRGCLGECSFCALNFHQGRIIQSRSHESILEEARQMTKDPDFKGYIHDVGGPTANFRVPACAQQEKRGACPNKRCLAPEPCRQLRVTHKDYVQLLRELRSLPGVKKVFIRSGIRFDYALLDPDHTFIRELAEYHTSGQLRLAPEHVSDRVLRVMGKPGNAVYQQFVREFDRASEAAGKEQYVLPYLMSSHPGSTMKEAVELAEFCRDLGYNPEQVSDFYPTPSTISTCIYYTGVDPRTMEPVYCPTDPHEKAMQRALIQYRNPKNRKLVAEALKRAGREDLIGYGPKCLIRPDRQKRGPASGGRSGSAHPPRGARHTGNGKGNARNKHAAAAHPAQNGQGKNAGRKPNGHADARTGRKPNGHADAGAKARGKRAAGGNENTHGKRRGGGNAHDTRHRGGRKQSGNNVR
ncbi:MAG: YgiQ family radical SAM protein [Eggerthellaceae bacterium]|jgi:uncharacterized radical SAM protein YgiQ